MAYSFQDFDVGAVLTAAEMDQVEINIRDHVHGQAGVSENQVGARYASDNVQRDATSGNSFIVTSFTVGSGTLGNTNMIRWSGILEIDGTDWDGGRSPTFDLSYGSTKLCSFVGGLTKVTGSPGRFYLNADLRAHNSLSTVQVGGLDLVTNPSGTDLDVTSAADMRHGATRTVVKIGISSEDSAADKAFSIVASTSFAAQRTLSILTWTAENL